MVCRSSDDYSSRNSESASRILFLRKTSLDFPLDESHFHEVGALVSEFHDFTMRFLVKSKYPIEKRGNCNLIRIERESTSEHIDHIITLFWVIDRKWYEVIVVK